jgi:hypothetical protein
MSLWSKQQFFCNACGKEFYEEYVRVFGVEFKVCSVICMVEMEWRKTLSVMGKEYYPYLKKDHD